MLLTPSDARVAWLLLRSKPRQESFALESLAARGLEVYCPRILQKRRYRSAPAGPVPLFTSYLFCRSALHEAFSAAGFAHGVAGFVKFGDRFAALEDDDVERMRGCEEGRGYLIPRDVRVLAQKGSRVKVTSGPFQGYEGVVEDYCSQKERVRLLLMLVKGRRMRVQLPTEQIHVA